MALLRAAAATRMALVLQPLAHRHGSHRQHSYIRRGTPYTGIAPNWDDDLDGET